MGVRVGLMLWMGGHFVATGLACARVAAVDVGGQGGLVVLGGLSCYVGLYHLCKLARGEWTSMWATPLVRVWVGGASV